MMPMQVDVAGLAGDAANVLEAACRGMDGVEAEGKDSDETDPGSRRLKRKQSNRESARRSRLRKQAEMADVCESVAELESGNAQLAEQVSALQQTATHIESSNRLLREMLSVVHDSAGVGAMQAVGCHSQPARLHPLMQQLAEVQAALAASRRAAAQAGAGAELEDSGGVGQAGQGVNQELQGLQEGEAQSESRGPLVPVAAPPAAAYGCAPGSCSSDSGGGSRSESSEAGGSGAGGRGAGRRGGSDPASAGSDIDWSALLHQDSSRQLEAATADPLGYRPDMLVAPPTGPPAGQQQQPQPLSPPPAASSPTSQAGRDRGGLPLEASRLGAPPPPGLDPVQGGQRLLTSAAYPAAAAAAAAVPCAAALALPHHSALAEALGEAGGWVRHPLPPGNPLSTAAPKAVAAAAGPTAGAGAATAETAGVASGAAGAGARAGAGVRVRPVKPVCLSTAAAGESTTLRHTVEEEWAVGSSPGQGSAGQGNSSGQGGAGQSAGQGNSAGQGSAGQGHSPGRVMAAGGLVSWVGRQAAGVAVRGDGDDDVGEEGEGGEGVGEGGEAGPGEGPGVGREGCLGAEVHVPVNQEQKEHQAWENRVAGAVMRQASGRQQAQLQQQRQAALGRRQQQADQQQELGASGSGQQVQGQGQAAKVVIAERRQVIKAGLRGLVEAARPDLSPAQVDAVVAEVNKRMTMGSKQCVLAAVLCLAVLLQSFLGQPTPGFPAAAGPAPGPPPPPDPAYPPYAHPRRATRTSPRSAAAPAQLPPPVQLDIEDPQLLVQIRDALDLLTKASVLEHLMRNKIAAIENLGTTENQFDSIDMSDNVVARLEGFPRLLRLTQLLLNNNRISRINKACHDAIPNLQTLILTNNRISNLQDLDPLSGFPKLTMLSLIGNPVVLKSNYRLYVIHKCKGLKVLDYNKVRPRERSEAQRLFPTEEAAQSHGAKTFEVDADYQAQTKASQQEQQQQQQQQAAKAAKGPSQDQLLAIKAAIANATTMDPDMEILCPLSHPLCPLCACCCCCWQTMEEIRRLEEALTTGHLPSGLVIPSSQPAPAPAPTPAPAAASVPIPAPQPATTAPQQPADAPPPSTAAPPQAEAMETGADAQPPPQPMNQEPAAAAAAGDAERPAAAAAAGGVSEAGQAPVPMAEEAAAASAPAGEASQAMAEDVPRGQTEQATQEAAAAGPGAGAGAGSGEAAAAPAADADTDMADATDKM
ncbi:hypothetical protein QJQ45_002559 [Haematococcus lacustris]|nr:hypothetical protein QJQ45_002559 [Haematococcus lacustris]